MTVRDKCLRSHEQTNYVRWNVCDLIEKREANWDLTDEPKR